MKKILFKKGKDLLCIKQNSRILCDKKIQKNPNICMNSGCVYFLDMYLYYV